MIERERLEELIEKGVTIYATGLGEIELIPENDIEIYENGKDSYIIYIFEPNRKYKNEIFAEELFETEEEAKWFAEFGCIERTERLELPTWEEFKEIGEVYAFFGADGSYWDLYSRDGDKKEIILLNGYKSYCFDYSKQGYLEACKIAKKLFLVKDKTS